MAAAPPLGQRHPKPLLQPATAPAYPLITYLGGEKAATRRREQRSSNEEEDQHDKIAPVLPWIPPLLLHIPPLRPRHTWIYGRTRSIIQIIRKSTGT
jgi:hypothetical protein